VFIFNIPNSYSGCFSDACVYFYCAAFDYITSLLFLTFDIVGNSLFLLKDLLCKN